jgi:diguanylate cyclase (GGDEF)-like protein
MSFRLRLTLFFALIVVLPMIALTVLVSQIAADSSTGKADARLQAGLQTATNLYDEAQERSLADARKIADRITADPEAVAAIEAGDETGLESLARSLREQSGVATLEIVATASGAGAIAGSSEPAASATVGLVGDEAETGRVTAAELDASELATRVSELTGQPAAVVGPEGEASGPAELDASELPADGRAADLEREGEDLRIAATEPLGDDALRIAMLANPGGESFFTSRPKIAIALLLFFGAALVAVLLILRSLQGQIREMLGAARRIARGDFSRKVPVSGSDEMAGLATEFNRMSDRLGEQMQELRRQQLELEHSVRRVGEAFASGLDRAALLSIVVETAVGTCEAEYGMVTLSGELASQTEFGDRTQVLRAAALAAEREAMDSSGVHERERDGAFAIASSLGSVGPSDEAVGAMAIARRDRPFGAAEREVFLYLLGQATASVENLALHEMVSEQAVTDELTGLANNRAFNDKMEKEAARATRFGHELSLLIVDLDDFKRVNDVHGHLQGDEVLRAAAGILRAESRGIDEPARYGGEEFVVALPETDHEGAVEVAERIRAQLAEVSVPLLEGAGEVAVTASIGVATIPDDAGGVKELIAVADAALYEAKRAGKNRVCSAHEGPLTPGSQAGAPKSQGAKGQPPARRS